LQNMIHDYLEDVPEMPIDDLVREVDLITRELNEFLARQLIEST